MLHLANLKQNISQEDIAAQLMEVQELAQKITGEKEVLKSILLVNDDFLQQTHKSFEDIQDQIKNQFEAINNENKIRYEKVHEMAINLRDELSKLKEQVEQTDKVLNSPELARSEQKPPKQCENFVESCVQTEESYEIIPYEVSDCSLSEEELLSLKQAVSVVMVESKIFFKDIILPFIKNFGKDNESATDIIKTSWDSINEEIVNFGSVLDKVHNIEQTVFGILIFLQQQSVDGQTIKETLKFFDHKLKISIQKIEARSNKNSLCLQIAFDGLQSARAVLNVSSLAFKDKSMDVARKLDCVGKMVTEFGYATKLLSDSEHLTYSIDRNVCDLIMNVDNLSSKINGVYCQKINKLSEELLAPREKLYVFYKTLEELHNLKFPSKSIPSNMQTSNSESKQQHLETLNSNEKTETGESKSSNGNLQTCASFEEVLNEILSISKSRENSKKICWHSPKKF